MTSHPIATPEVWLAARKELLAKEKELTRRRDELSRLRRDLPWVRVDKPYAFEGPGGTETLDRLFEGRSQLIIYHFMFGPAWPEGCPGCSFTADTFDGADVHLRQRDVTFAAVSRAPLPQIQAFQKRMGWKFKWLSSYGSDFNFDYHVSFTPEQLAGGEPCYNFGTIRFRKDEAPGTSVFYRDDGAVYHTYSAFARGGEALLGAYHLLDLVPKGRNEEGLDCPMAWVRHHDRYPETANTAETVASCCAAATRS
jgi:predicted dithiol-disulfide oxidoreductase (DUF899 family)